MVAVAVLPPLRIDPEPGGVHENVEPPVEVLPVNCAVGLAQDNVKLDGLVLTFAGATVFMLAATVAVAEHPLELFVIVTLYVPLPWAVALAALVPEVIELPPGAAHV